MLTTSKSVVLAGATGYIGRAVAAELVRQDYRVIALARQAVEIDGCEVREVEITDEDSLASALCDMQNYAVISCIASRSGEPEDAWRVDYEANRNLLSVATQADASHFVLLSAICVQKPELAFQHTKLKFEKALIESGVSYSIVRPTAFFKSLSGQVDRVLAGKPFIVFGNGRRTACKPISEGDLARYLVDCLKDPDLENRILPIGGPGPAMTPHEQGMLLFELAGRKPRFRHVSPGIFSVVSAILAPFAAFSTKIAAKAELARIGRYYATESMLTWDAEREQYDADATPETGSDTLRDHYAKMLESGAAGQELGEHKIF